MKRILLFSALFLMLAAQAGWAQVPQTISYQGVLTDASGVPVADSPPASAYTLTFRLYEAATGGTASWTETHNNVSTSKGIFNVILGKGSPTPNLLNIPFDKPYWLEIELNGLTLVPRVELTSAAYSLNARSVADNAVTTAKIADNAVTSAKFMDGTIATAKIADGAITTAKIADGTIAAGDIADGTLTGLKISSSQVVRSINTLKDDVTLAEGNNVTITPSGSTLTISAANAVGNTLDQAYDQGGAGAGRTITADAGAVHIQGTDGLIVSGNVGIGTASPGQQLETYGASPQIRIRNSGTSASQWVEFGVTTGGAWDRVGFVGQGNTGNQISLWNDKNAEVIFGTSGTERMRIDGSGNVGINTTNPDNYPNGWGGDRRVLTISGVSGAAAGILQCRSASAGSTTEAVGHVSFLGGWSEVGRVSGAHDGASNSGALLFSTVSSGSTHEKMRISSNGNVGIGTTNPSRRLHVSGSIAADTVFAVTQPPLSSRRWKTNIQTLQGGLGKIRRLRGVSFDWKENKKRDIGLIAEEVGEVVPEVVSYEANGKDAKGVDYGHLVGLLIEAVKEQQGQIEALTRRVAELEKTRSRTTTVQGSSAATVAR